VTGSCQLCLMILLTWNSEQVCRKLSRFLSKLGFKYFQYRTKLKSIQIIKISFLKHLYRNKNIIKCFVVKL
jgi:hypothetical protein